MYMLGGGLVVLKPGLWSYGGRERLFWGASHGRERGEGGGKEKGEKEKL